MRAPVDDALTAVDEPLIVCLLYTSPLPYTIIYKGERFPMKYDGIIFDLDGTLWDAVEAVSYTHLGIEPTLTA